MRKKDAKRALPVYCMAERPVYGKTDRGRSQKKFEIFRVLEVTWKPENFSLNLARFYGKNCPKDVKRKETGAGTFRVYLVYDHNPQYANGKNVNIVKSKYEYRQLTGGGNLVHASDNPQETNENLLLLFGKTIKDFEQEGPDTAITPYGRDLVGCPVWEKFGTSPRSRQESSVYTSQSL